MVRGSDSESGDKEFSKSKYDGTVGRWPPGRIKLKSTLFTRGLWDVVEKGRRDPPQSKHRRRP